MKELLEGSMPCQPTVYSCFSDVDREHTTYPVLGRLGVRDKDRFVTALYCAPERRYVGFRPFDGKMTGIVFY